MSAGKVLVVDDESDIRSLVRDILSDEGYEVEVAADASQARAARDRMAPDLVLLDIWMPDTDGISLLREWSRTPSDDCSVVMMSGHGTVETAVEATRLGAFDFVEKPLSLAKLLRTVERAMEAGRRKRLAAKASATPLLATVGKSRVTQQLRADLQAAAPHATPLLLVGESGTLRESLARFVHDASPRSALPFVTLVASSVTDADAEAVLLGSGSGESAKPGLLAQAGAGTLLVSDIEELAPQLQRLLLGVLESGSWRSPGDAAAQPLAARIVATARPGVELRAGSSGSVRRDLFERLDGLLVRVPPLRDYAEDVPDLLRYHVDRLVDSERLPFRRFSVAAQNRLRNYPWPGNVRELRGLVRRMLVMGGPEEISLEQVERELSSHAPGVEPLVKQDLLALPLREAREQFERAYLQQQLLLCNGKVGQLAKRVGMERTHLYRKLRSLGVDFRQGADD